MNIKYRYAIVAAILLITAALVLYTVVPDADPAKKATEAVLLGSSSHPLFNGNQTKTLIAFRKKIAELGILNWVLESFQPPGKKVVYLLFKGNSPEGKGQMITFIKVIFSDQKQNKVSDFFISNQAMMTKNAEAFRAIL